MNLEQIVQFVINDYKNKYGQAIKQKVVSRAYGLAKAYNIQTSIDILNELYTQLLSAQYQGQTILPVYDIKNVYECNNSILRFAPNPNAGPTIGNLRGLILHKLIKENSKNCKLYLRFDDTDPTNKKPILSAYEKYLDAVKYFKVPIDKVFYASDRLSLYYEKACYLVNKNLASIEGYKIQHSSRYKTNTVVKFKQRTIILRSSKLKHCRSKYWLWPTLHFQSVIDDIDLKITHIFRGIDLQSTEHVQKQLYEAFNSKIPRTKYWGRLKIENKVISSSKIKENFNVPTYDFIRMSHLPAEAFVEFFKQLGFTRTSSELNLHTLYKYIKKYLKPLTLYNSNSLLKASRLFSNEIRYIKAVKKKLLCPNTWYRIDTTYCIVVDKKVVFI